MAELLLVSNPHRRKRRKASPAQLRARKRFVARYGHSSGGLSMARKKRRVRRSKSKTRRVTRKYARNPAFRKSRRYRRNPSMRGLGGSFMSSARRTVKEGAMGAVGAIGMDLVYGYGAQYLPEMFKTGYAKYATKGLMSVMVGMIGGRFLRGQGAVLATGGMTVVLHDALKELLLAQMPTLPLSEYLAYAPGSGPIVGTYGDQGLGALPDLSNGMDSLGFNSFETNTLDEYLTESPGF